MDTPKALETTVSASFAASHHQINRTLVLATEEPLVPSSGFATAVMEQVREAASAPPPLPFPWRRFVVGALVVAVMSGLSGWLLATLPVAASLPAALDRLLAAVADRQVALALASTLGSLLGTLLLVRLSLSLAGGRG